MTLELTAATHQMMIDHCLAAYPLEGCGLLGAAPDEPASRCYTARNVEASARIYTVDPRDHLRADLDAEASGLEIIGVFHSHTHTPAYPSPTDVASAPDPNWHYVLVSFEHADDVRVRSFRIVDGAITEESVVLR